MRRIIPVLLAALLALGVFLAPAGAGATDVDPYDYLEWLFKQAEQEGRTYGPEYWVAKLQEVADQYVYEIGEDPSFAQRELATSYYRYALAVIELYKEEPDYRKAEELLRKLGENEYYRFADCLLLAQGMRELEDGDYYNGISDLKKVEQQFPEQFIIIDNRIGEAGELYREAVMILLQNEKDVQTVQAEYIRYMELYPTDREITDLYNSFLEARKREEENQGDGTGTDADDREAQGLFPGGRKLAVAAEEAEGGILLTWTDSEEGHTYTVTFGPENGNTDTELTLADTGITLDRLIPGTRYCITVADAEDEEVAVSCTARTRPAEEMYKDWLECQSCRMMKVNKTLLRKKPLDELARTGGGAFVQADTMQRGELGQNMPVCCVTFWSGSKDAAPVSVQAVLRSENSGTWQSEAAEAVIPAPDKTGQASLLFPAEEILNEAKAGRDSIPADTYTYELYIDGELCGSAVLTVSD